MRLVLVLIALVAAGEVAVASSLHLQSPRERVPMLELFTSHGCSSCPPADRWLRRFTERPGLWTEVIPLSFHVDYWDRLGWPDRFASEGFSRRQRDYRRTGHVNSVYTPGFVVNGKEWRGWFRGSQPELSPGRRVGTLSLTMDTGDSARLRFEPAGRPQAAALRAHLAVLGFGLSTPVDGGENAGRILKEDFVVLGYRSTGQAGDKRQWTVALPETVPAETSRRALVAWVSAGDDPAPVQAVAGWLP